MKRLILILLLLAGVSFSAAAQSTVIPAKTNPADGSTVITLENPNSYALQDAIVVLKIENTRFQSAQVKVGSKVIPSQFDILDNGATRELAFVIDLKAKQKQKVTIRFSESDPDPNAFPARTHAQMFRRENGQNTPKTEIMGTENNMYNQLQAHGPQFESELTAYRVYFDHKQTVDIYGKIVKRIELPATMFYPNDQQLLEKYGDDVLNVGSSAGLGALKGWDGTKATHIEPMTSRTARVLATGPVRAMVEMDVKGWEYNGRVIDICSRYTIYAGHRDVYVQSRIKGQNTDGLEFSTGLLKMRKGDTMITDDEGMIAIRGRDFPVGDTVKYGMQTVGLGISVPKQYLVKPAQDNLNYLYVVKPDANNEINYRITFGAEKEEFGYKTIDDFFRYVETWNEEKPVVVTIKK